MKWRRQKIPIAFRRYYVGDEYSDARRSACTGSSARKRSDDAGVLSANAERSGSGMQSEIEPISGGGIWRGRYTPGAGWFAVEGDGGGDYRQRAGVEIRA